MKFIVYLKTIFLVFFILSCTSNQQKPNDQIIIGISGDVDTFNPLFAESSTSLEIGHLVNLGLADLNENSEFQPEIAERWESSSDNLELTYYINKNARWSDGKPITAGDVKFTYDLLMDTATASPRSGYIEFIKDVVILDDHTVKFVFTEAYPAQIFDTAGEILPQHYLKDVSASDLRTHDYGKMPLSSGPYKLNKWERQQYIELIANDNYWANSPTLKKIIFKIIPDASNQLLQLKSGEIDMMVGIPPAEITKIKTEYNDISIYQVSGRVYYFVGYNYKHPLFKDLEIRKALTMAIDRQKIIDALLYGFGSKCLGPLPPIVKWAYNEDVQEVPFDIDQAKQILQSKGWSDSDNDGYLDRNGKTFEFKLKTDAGNQIKSDVAVIVQDQLKKLGVKVDIEPMEWTALINDLQNKNFDACVNGWSMSYYIDPTPIFHSSATNMFNFNSYSNKKVDELIEKGRVEMDQEKAALLWKEFQQEVYKDQPYTFLFWIDKAVGIHNRFKNATPLALSSVYNIENWYVEAD